MVTYEFTDGRFTEDAYSLDGGQVWRWSVNGAIIATAACIAFRVPCDIVAQSRAYRADRQAALDATRHMARAC